MKNNIAIPLLATVMLSIITGIAGMHYLKVQEMVRNGAVTSSSVMNATETAAHNQSTHKDSIKAIPTPQVPVIKKKETPPTHPAAIGAAQTPREDALLKLLAEQTKMLAAMRAEQKHLRKQLSETNRDMDELTFRVDSHSSDFRPLRVDSARPRGLSTSIPSNLPDAEAGNGSLLPAKR